MRIEVGQDAVGRWAWVITDEGKRVASDDDYPEASLAMRDAATQLELLERSRRRKFGRE